MKIRHQYIETKYVKRAVCRCGFSVLRDEIELGRIFQVDPGHTEIGGLICGQCGRFTHNLKMIWAVDTVNGNMGLLPSELFDIERVQ